jgi:hypothetical protein
MFPSVHLMTLSVLWSRGGTVAATHWPTLLLRPRTLTLCSFKFACLSDPNQYYHSQIKESRDENKLVQESCQAIVNKIKSNLKVL